MTKLFTSKRNFAVRLTVSICISAILLNIAVATSLTKKINTTEFYKEFFGHDPQHLKVLAEHFRKKGRDIIWLIGDSSLDNKHWVQPPFFNDFEENRPARNGYEHVLNPSNTGIVPDIAWHLNRLLEEDGTKSSSKATSPYVTINTAVEMSMLGCYKDHGRCVEELPPYSGPSKLFPQEIMLRKSIMDESSGNDVMIVSVGSNDYLFSPSVEALEAVENHAEGPGDTVSFAKGEKFWLPMRGIRTRRFLEGIISSDPEKQRPKLIIVCQIYFLDKKGKFNVMTHDVRDFFELIKHDVDPRILMHGTREGFNGGTLRVGDPDGHIHGVPVFPIPLFEVLDGNNTTDYVERLEPSFWGGEKIAATLKKELTRALSGGKPRTHKSEVVTFPESYFTKTESSEEL